MANTHVLLFPFPDSGHLIPLLDLANLLLIKGLTITILITPPNLPLLQPLISAHPSTSLHPLILPLPAASQTDSSGLSFLVSQLVQTRQLYDPILQWFHSQQFSQPVAIISDFFLGWTHHLAQQLGVPRLVFWPSGVHDSLILHHLWHNYSDSISSLSDDSLITFPNLPNSPVFPFWKVSQLITQSKKGDPNWDFYRENFLLNAKSSGWVFNSFMELEGSYIDCARKLLSHDHVWAVGPLVLGSINNNSRGGSSAVPINHLVAWLDDKPAGSVVFVSFGTRVVLTSKQTEALEASLESSGVHFVWSAKEATRSCDDYGGTVSEEFENRVSGKGLVIRGWAPQVAVLKHRAVGAFVTHCGWNSVLEGMAAGVLLLTWPMGADQFENARLLVDELGLAVQACEGGPVAVPDSAELANILAQSVSVSDHYRRRRERARSVEMRDVISGVMENGGSSSRDLDQLVKHLSQLWKSIN